MGWALHSIRLSNYFLLALLIVVVTLLSSCGNNEVPKITVQNKATITITRSGSGKYEVHGDHLDGVAGIQIVIDYDITTMTSPMVTKTEFGPNALMITNTVIPGSIRISIINSDTYLGSGEIANITFENVTGTEIIAISSVKMIDINSNEI